LSSGCGRCVSEKLLMNLSYVCLRYFLCPYFGHTNTPRGSVCLLNNTRQEKVPSHFKSAQAVLQLAIVLVAYCYCRTFVSADLHRLVYFNVKRFQRWTIQMCCIFSQFPTLFQTQLNKRLREANDDNHAISTNLVMGMKTLDRILCYVREYQSGAFLATVSQT
jgi:hypothetical protein